MEVGFEIKVQQPYHISVTKVIEALKKECFGVLTQIDVQSTLNEKIGEDFRPYVILGACNHPLVGLAHDGVVGLMLPCNVTVEADEEAGSIVRIVNPRAMMTVGDLQSDDILVKVVTEARTRLERVVQSLTE